METLALFTGSTWSSLDFEIFSRFSQRIESFFVMHIFLNVYDQIQFTETYRGKFAISTHSVDVFFTISGLLVAIKMFNLLKK